MIGTSLQHYQITAKLGAGGMGEVYRATDTKLGREVAIKVLPGNVSRDPQSLARFHREAKALATLNHPNVAAIYGFEADQAIHFLVLELVEGETLGQRLAHGAFPVKEALAIARQVAEAIQEAHQKGVIHRDLKPGNVKITPNGRVKVLDFGLAKLTENQNSEVRDQKSRVDENAATLVESTQPGLVLGTPAYMSPEQARGQEVDKRTDIWAFGCCLYECLSGCRPFQGETVSDLMAEVLKSEPDWSRLPAETPHAVVTLLHRCLEKEPSRRLSNIGDIALMVEESTRGSTASSSPPRPTNIPLTPPQPLTPTPTPNLTLPPPGGITITSKIRSKSLMTICVLALLIGAVVFYWRQSRLNRQVQGGSDVARTNALPASSAASTVAPAGETNKSIAVLAFANLSEDKENEYFSDGISEELLNVLAKVPGLRVTARTSSFSFKGKNVPEIARQLNVAYVMDGSVRRSGDRVRITARLINAADGFHVSSQDFDRELKDIFALQDEIARAVVAKLKVTLAGTAGLPSAKGHTENIAAYELYLKGRFYLERVTEAGTRQAMACFEQALPRQPDYAPAQAGLADSYLTLRYFGYASPASVTPQLRAAVARVLELDNSLADAHASLAGLRFFVDWDWTAAERSFRRALELDPANVRARQWYALLLSSMERHSEAIAEAMKALEIDPLSAVTTLNAGWIFCFAGEYDRAVELGSQAIAMAPDFFRGHFLTGTSLFWKGQREEGIAQLETAARLAAVPEVLRALGGMYGNVSRTADAQRILDQLLAQAKQQYVPALAIAQVYNALGNFEQGNLWMNRAIAEREGSLVFLKANPIWRGTSPHYPEWLKKIGLEK